MGGAPSTAISLGRPTGVAPGPSEGASLLTTIERPGHPSPGVGRPDDPVAIRRALAEKIRAAEVRTGEDRLLALEPGRVIALHGAPGSGLTRVGLALLADVARQAPVVAVDARGWISPLAAWEAGIDPERFVVVREVAAPDWPRVVGTLLDGVRAVYAEVPAGVPETVVRRVGAAARSKRVGLVLRPVRGVIPSGVAHLTLVAEDVRWEGIGTGVGHLGARSLSLRASGKAVAGIERRLEVDDDGTHPLHLVGRVAPPAARRTAG